MEHFGDELDVWGLGWVLLGEAHPQLKQSPLPCNPLRPLDEGAPVVEIALLRRGIDAFVLLLAHLLQVSDQSLLRRITHY